MKTKLFFAAIAAVAVVSCGGNKLTDEQLSQAYEQKVTELGENLNSQIEAWQKAEMPEEELNSKAEALYEETVGQLVDYSKKLVKKYSDRPIAVEAIGQLQHIVEPAELEELVNKLSEENKQDESIQKIIAGLDSKKNTAEGKPFTDFTIIQDPESPETSTVSFSDYIGKGKYILVDFWASWCGPCRREIPNIKAVYEKYAGEDFDVLSVAVWDKLEDTKAAAEELGIVWNQIVNAQRIPTDIYGIEGIPQIILFGPDGTILKRDLRDAAIEEEVAKYVKK